MDVRLLGGMEVIDDEGNPLSVQGARLRTLFALLALDSGRVVSTDQLIEDVWGDDAPASVANALQALVSKLRKSLGSGDIVAMRPPGYVLVIEPEAVAVHRLDRLTADGRAAAALGELDDAVTKFAAAESLWRGPALVDFAYEEFAAPH